MACALWSSMSLDDILQRAKADVLRNVRAAPLLSKTLAEGDERKTPRPG